MEVISKNCHKGELLTNPNDILELALQRRSVYTQNWGIKPASIYLSMQLRFVLQLIKDRKLYFVVRT